MLQLHRVRFAFGASAVLHDVTARIATGSLVGLLGPNGSGKTTLLKLISRGLTPGTGHILLDGVDISTLGRGALARRLAVVPQETELAFDYSALEIVLMGRYPHLGAFEVEGPADLAIAMDAMRQTGTVEFADRAFRTLSGGEKQRVVIASALAQLVTTGIGHRASGIGHGHQASGIGHPASGSGHQAPGIGHQAPGIGHGHTEGPASAGLSAGQTEGPASAGPVSGRAKARPSDGTRARPSDGTAANALLLLDEPTASLDLKYQLEIAALLRRLHDAGGITIVVSTHDLRFAESVCTEVILLSRGRVLAQGAPADVLTPALVGEVYGIEPDVAAPLLIRR